jgi:hypothetical protein
MRKLFALNGLLILVLIPIVIFYLVKNYYDYYDNLGKQYDCYPIEKCQIDIDGDLKSEIIKVIDESTPNNKFNLRLKVFLNREIERTEILDLKYDPTDNTLRTHIAFLVEDETRKFIIYDTKNEYQYFYWNGQQLVPSYNPSELEKEIRKALGYNDDTGGFHTKIFYPFLLIPVLIIYYSLFFILIGVYVYLRKNRNLTLP